VRFSGAAGLHPGAPSLVPLPPLTRRVIVVVTTLIAEPSVDRIDRGLSPLLTAG
jgi:hypothetical protein